MNLKNNMKIFDDDILKNGSYIYRIQTRLSSKLACKRISTTIANCISFKEKNIIDIGCGDGVFTLEMFHLGAKSILGIDIAEDALNSARERAIAEEANAVVKFSHGNIYNLDEHIHDEKFDYIMLWGVLHHLPDPEHAIAGLCSFKGKVIIVEPNGSNPIVKIIEKTSRYHIDHEERSYRPAQIQSWLTKAGFDVKTCKMMNLVPMFCPNWMASTLDWVSPFVEKIPFIRTIACGQTLIIAEKK